MGAVAENVFRRGGGMRAYLYQRESLAWRQGRVALTPQMAPNPSLCLKRHGPGVSKVNLPGRGPQREAIACASLQSMAHNLAHASRSVGRWNKVQAGRFGFRYLTHEYWGQYGHTAQHTHLCDRCKSADTDGWTSFGCWRWGWQRGKFVRWARSGGAAASCHDCRHGAASAADP